MKRLLIFLSLMLFLISCKNNSHTEIFENVDDSSIEGYYTFENSYTEVDIIHQKLQEYYDLSLLKQLHPEFEDELIKQIKSLSDNEAHLIEKTDSIKITNLEQIGSFYKESDSISRIKLRYEVVYDNTLVIDSISAIIKTRNVKIEDRNYSSTKIRFEKTKN